MYFVGRKYMLYGAPVFEKNAFSREFFREKFCTFKNPFYFCDTEKELKS